MKPGDSFCFVAILPLHEGKRIRYSSLAVVLCKLYCSSNYRTQANKHGFGGRGISTEHRKHTCSMNFFSASWQWGSITMVLFRVVIDIAHDKESFCSSGTRVVRKTKKDGLVITGIQPIKWILLSSRMLCHVDCQTRNFVSGEQHLYPLRWYYLRSNMTSWSPRSPPYDPQILKKNLKCLLNDQKLNCLPSLRKIWEISVQ